MPLLVGSETLALILPGSGTWHASFLLESGIYKRHLELGFGVPSTR